MKTDNEKEPKFFRWIRAVRAEIDHDTKDMTPDEWVAYSNARAQKARESFPKFSPEEAEAIIRSALYPEENPVLLRKSKAKAKTPTKPAAGRRKVAKRLAPA